MTNETTLLFVAIIGGLFTLITTLVSAEIASRKERKSWENETAIKFIEYSLTNPDVARKVARQFSIAVLVQLDNVDTTIDKFFLPAFCRFSIGRNEDHDICISDGYLSRDHGLFYYKEGNIFYKDTSALNPTLVNGKKINDTKKLINGDLLTFGKTKMKFVKL